MMGRGLKWGGRIDRYVGSLFLASYATAFLLVVGLFLVLDMASNLDDYLELWPDGTRAPTFLIARYYLFQIPFVFLQVAPFITLVAGLFTVSRLLKHNETIAALAGGISAHRMLAPVFLIAACMAAGMFQLREVLASDLANKRDAVRFVLENKNWDRKYGFVRVRDLNGSFVQLNEYRPAVGNPPVAEVRGLQAIWHSSGQSIEASRAVWTERGSGAGWLLEDGVFREVRSDNTRVERPVRWLDGFDFTPSLALSYWRAREHAVELSFGEVKELMRRDPDRAVYQTMFQYSLTFPLANLVLLLVGLPILLRHERGKGAEGLALGCLLCVFYFATDFVFRNLGLQSSMDPRYAAWLPILFFGSLGLVLFDSMRT
ncbi:MAG: LptF/LptG family permease [Planctomycetes bacterium]|nr:LptF/LptG family permease [Planctomycetota bacterium]